MAPDLPPASASFPHPAGQRKASSPPDPLGTSSSHSPTHYNLSSLLKSPAGITEEGEGFGWGHLMDGRYTVPQVHSKLLCRGRRISASTSSPASCSQNSTPPIGTLGPSPAICPHPLTSPTQLLPPRSPGLGDGRYTSHYSLETASLDELPCLPVRT